jgi:hypothetical protein
MKTEKIRKELRRQLDFLCDRHEELMLKASELNLKLIEFERMNTIRNAKAADRSFKELERAMGDSYRALRLVYEEVAMLNADLRIE